MRHAHAVALAGFRLYQSCLPLPLLSAVIEDLHQHSGREVLLMGNMLPLMFPLTYASDGEKGTGKTLSLCHAIHFCAKHDWLILHIPDAHLWVKNCRELLQSTYNKQRFDQPLEASTWLKNFKTTNERFLSQIKVQEKYVWNKRESTEKGSPLGEVVEQVHRSTKIPVTLSPSQRRHRPGRYSPASPHRA